ncbi:hypothetical protein PAXRUDRAFT_647789, partial [Paxillus rubicundulus Ve08.2h10]
NRLFLLEFLSHEIPPGLIISHPFYLSFPLFQPFNTRGGLCIFSVVSLIHPEVIYWRSECSLAQSIGMVEILRPVVDAIA